MPAIIAQGMGANFDFRRWSWLSKVPQDAAPTVPALALYDDDGVTLLVDDDGVTILEDEA